MEDFLIKARELLSYTTELMTSALLIGRTMPMIVLTPFLAGKIAPTELKMGLGISLSLLIWPVAITGMTGQLVYAPGPFLLLMLKETFIGFAIGFVNAHIFYAMEMSGRIIDTVRGVSMAEVQVPHSQQRSTLTGSLYYQLLLIVFFAAGGHHVFFNAYFDSYLTIPINEGIATGLGLTALTDFIAKLTGDILTIAVRLAAPIIAATLITDIVFGILNRVAPQLNAYFMSMPVKALGGVIVIFIAFTAVLASFSEFTIWGSEAMKDLIAYFSKTIGL